MNPFIISGLSAENNTAINRLLRADDNIIHIGDVEPFLIDRGKLLVITQDLYPIEIGHRGHWVAGPSPTQVFDGRIHFHAGKFDDGYNVSDGCNILTPDDLLNSCVDISYRTPTRLDELLNEFN